MEQNAKILRKKLGFYFIFVVALFLALLARLFYLQVFLADQYQSQSEQNRTRMVSITAQRGEILDRNGKVMATSKPVFSISISNWGLKNQDEVVARLVEILGDAKITPEMIKEKLKNNTRRYEPVEVKSLPWSDQALEIVTRIEERRQELPGVLIQEAPMRYYPGGSLAGHLLGFVGQISKGELAQYSEYNYHLNDKIGKTGLEATQELVFNGKEEIGLRGEKGVSQVEVNASNRPVRELPTIAPTPGANVELTLDMDLQQVAETMLDGVITEVKKQNPKAGAAAIVVLDVRTGAILAMASKPDINPNDFVDGSFREKASYYNDQKLNPSLNRAIQGVYPPGSVFKMVTGMAALESGKVKPSDIVTCQGAYWKPPYVNCWKAHGPVDFFQAMAVSCNTYFQWAGDMAGIDNIDWVAAELGLGQKTGINDLPGEAAGLLPSPQWKNEVNTVIINRRFDNKRAELASRYDALKSEASTQQERESLDRQERQEKIQLEAQYRIEINFYTNWQPYETFITSIGQGSNSYTVLQLANYVATIANGGTRYRPYLVQKITSPEGKVMKEFQPTVAHQVSLSPETLAITKKGMRGVVEYGTGYGIFAGFPVPVAAKTGTAQTGREGDNPEKDYFGSLVAFAPADNPQIAFAGVVEYSDGGGAVGKVARAVFAKYFGIVDRPVLTADQAVNGQLAGPSGQPVPAETPPGTITENNNQAPAP